MEEVPTSYEPIYLATPNPYNGTSGILKLAKQGIGWKNSRSGEVTTFSADDIKRAQWMRAARQFRLKLIMKNGTWHKLDNFTREDYENIKHLLKTFYRITLETRDLSLKGSNWGKTEFQGDYLTFNHGNRTIFEVPLADVANTNLAGKSEVSLEFLPPDRLNQADAGRAKSARVDELVEMRFYIPGTTTASKAAKMEKAGTEGNLPGAEEAEGTKAEGNDGDASGSEGSEAEQSDADEEAQNAANVFHDMVKNKADLGQVAGESIALFQEILALTPRGRYDMDMFPNFMRLRGKTYDYKIGYDSVVKLFLLSKPDDLHMLFVIGLDPPIRQGQTRYPFLVFQFTKDEEMDIELNLDEATLADEYQGKLQKQYSEPTFQVVASVFRGLTGCSVAVTGHFKSLHNTSALKCSLKANEGHLYPLQKCFLFVPKPPTFIPHAEIGSVSFSRVGATATGASRTFDLKFNMLGGGGDYQFSSIPKEEYSVLEAYLREKNIKMKNELLDDAQAYSSLGAMGGELSDSDGEAGGGGKRQKTSAGSGPTSFAQADFGDDDDDESPDEDYIAESEESDDVEGSDEEFVSDNPGDDD
ncbi:FACT complex subunit [Tieghemiomyces parasiticus]|uniref:FACT complex subunit POB3 n=1 Tax=Tieghemiomyces parasiticus TaxID=78921 RepID=A0A9W8AE47_9FUNG|nr:FACT complex subunit [Tieghemiomyces parasiticus]